MQDGLINEQFIAGPKVAQWTRAWVVGNAVVTICINRPKSQCDGGNCERDREGIRRHGGPFEHVHARMAMSRNDLCSCGSGKRFKHCHGKVDAAPPASSVRFDALAAHRAGSLGRAEALYRRALEENPQDVDSLHMLGVVQYERMRYREALDILWDAAERTRWSVPLIRHNMGLVLGKLLSREANVRQAALLDAFVVRERARKRAIAEVAPLVSVVLPAYNHARFVAQAIASVAAQTYPHIELIVIDDGSTDNTAAVIAECLSEMTLPARFIARENRGAPATLNEGATLARGQYLAFLNSDDYYAPDRIERMVKEIAGTGSLWGFSLVSNAAVHAGAAPISGADPDMVLQKQRNFLGAQPTSFTLVEYNVAVSSGNLFVERGLFSALGGFRDFRYNHDWDFCLRASEVAEPIVVDSPLYFYRVHAGNTISESKDSATGEADAVFSEFLARALTSGMIGRNELGPQHPENRSLLLRSAFRIGQGALVPVGELQAAAAGFRTAASPSSVEDRVAARIEVRRKTAMVVLGMHRSGTSATSRVLNLCGAYLPEKIKPPKLGVNPKGFWEAEAVLDLNVRVMRQLGGDWDHVGFALPRSGDLIDEFQSDARALLHSEYQDRDFILIKDPRICILAPLWHRALLAAGYRPVYVVPVRNPLEVARSLHARGDMSIEEGLQLWLAYMKRIVAFADEYADVLYLRYADLLDDWRGIIGRTAERLDVPLVIGDRAQEVSHFLERDLRNQRADDEALDAHLSGISGNEIRELYDASLARCDRDKGIAGAPFPTTDATIALDPGRQRPLPSATFVLCIENNGIREQALLHCESIRRFAGRYSNAPIIAYAPRPGLGVDRRTRSLLADLGVEYVDEPLNTTCHEYAPANRVFAGAHAERDAHTDFVVVVDSDTVWLGEPELPVDADVAVRPVDEKGSATRGPDDRFEAYWQTLADLCGIPLDRLPWLHSTIGGERIRASYNGGLVVARRELGICKRCADLFSASVVAGMRPQQGMGRNVHASTGYVGREGSEYWGSSQAALALAIWATTNRVVHYPDHYNVPLHLIAADSDIDPRWLVRPPVHLHYHWMFGARHHQIAVDLLERLDLAADRRAWLAGRIPFDDAISHSVAGEAVNLGEEQILP